MVLTQSTTQTEPILIKNGKQSISKMYLFAKNHEHPWNTCQSRINSITAFLLKSAFSAGAAVIEWEGFCSVNIRVKQKLQVCCDQLFRFSLYKIIEAQSKTTIHHYMYCTLKRKTVLFYPIALLYVSFKKEKNILWKANIIEYLKWTFSTSLFSCLRD